MMQRTAPNGAVPACRKSPPAAAFSDKTRFPCSQISKFCALAARSPCICSRLQGGRGNAQGNLAAQGCRIHRACQRGRPPAGSGQPVPRSRGIPSPNRRFGEGIGDSEYSSEGCGPPNLPEGFFDSLSRSKVCSGFAAVRWEMFICREFCSRPCLYR